MDLQPFFQLVGIILCIMLAGDAPGDVRALLDRYFPKDR